MWYNLKKETSSFIGEGQCEGCSGYLIQGQVVYCGNTDGNEEFYYHQEEVPYISELYPERFV